MDTKKAIEFLESFKDKVTSIDIEEGNERAIEEYNDELNKVINLLQRGEKYEAMFKTFVQFIFNWRYPISHKVMRDKVKELRQKYFLKE